MRPQVQRAGAVAGALSIATAASLSTPAQGAELVGTVLDGGGAMLAAPTLGMPTPPARQVVHVRATRLHVRAGTWARVAGRVSPAAAGVRMSLQIRRPGGWHTVARTRTGAGGAYRLRERAGRTGATPVRVIASAHGALPGARRRIGRLHVYRVTYASWYGPGFYGRPLGCGGVLQAGRLGVAHRTLPCGTRVTFRRGGRSVTVAVIDRGPYVGGREYDLTEATAQRLRFQGHGAILATR